jgi:hypothetical protein
MIISPICTYFVKKRLENATVTEENKKQYAYFPRVTAINELKSAIFFLLFYSSISFPIFMGLITHLFDLNISWGSTVKSLESDNFFVTIKKIILCERLQLCIFTIYLALLIFTMDYIHYDNLYVISVLFIPTIGHLIAPFLLNPMLYNYKEFEYDISNTP